MRERIQNAQSWVIKVGTGVLLRDGFHIDRPTFASLVEGIDALLCAGKRVTLVSSGAVALGRQVIGDRGKRTQDLSRLQALAALGQARLIQMYDREFAQYERPVAQVLFTRTDLNRRESFLNARLTLETLYRLNAVPVINENDTVATQGLRFDDNDQLAAMTCALVQADVFVILSDVEGVLELHIQADGTRVLGDRIPTIDVEDPHLMEVAGPSTSSHGTGGMVSKIGAAGVAARLGVPTVIAAGKRPGVLKELLTGQDVGTVILPHTEPVQGRKAWIESTALSVGKVHCDAGAVRAIAGRGASLLPSGVVRVEGEFEAGDVIELVSPDNRTFAKGVILYPSVDARQIAGHHSREIPELLGYHRSDTLIHRDSLVVVEPG